MKTEKEILNQIHNELQLGNWYQDLIGQEPRFSDFDPDLAESGIPRTEIRAAETISKKLASHLTYDSATRTWYIWNGQIHRPCTGDGIAKKLVQLYYRQTTEALEFVKDAIEGMAEHMAASGVDKADEKAQEIQKRYNWQFGKHRRFRDRISTDQGQRAVVEQLKVLVDEADYLDDRRWFVVENGVFDMEAVRRDRRFDLLPHDASRPVYRVTFPAMDAPGSDYPALKRFLGGSIADGTQSRFLSKAFAAGMMGTPEKTKTIVSIQGKTNSGKSMLLDIVDKLCGDAGIYAAPSPDAITKYGSNKKHARYPMRNARIVGFSEVREKLDETFILQYTGGDKFPVEEKYVASSSVNPQGIIFVANNKPLNVDKSDQAMFPRVAPISFPYTFSKADPDHYEDENLASDIINESSGFLEWMKWSFLAYLEEGLDKSESMEALKRGEVEDSSTIAQFLASRIESGRYAQDPTAPISKCVTKSELHVDYVDYCKSHNIKSSEISDMREMTEYLEDHNMSIKRSNGTRVSGLKEGSRGY